MKTDRIIARLKSPTPSLFWQLVRYAVSGGVATVVDFAVLWLLCDFAGWHYLLGAACGYAVGLAITYLMSVLWIFDQRRLSNRVAEFLAFALIAGVGIGLTQLFMWLFTDIFGVYYLYSKLITTVVVSLVNFVLKKTLLFSAKK